MDNSPLRRRIEVRPTPSGEESADAGRWERAPAEPEGEQAAPNVRGVVREMLETAIFVLLIFLIVRGVVQNFKIEGQSMEPNFHSGQYILVNKIIYFHFDLNAPLRLLPGRSELPPRVVYPFKTPQRGEVVVFEYPRDLSKDYIKRVIGLPGETVMVRDGRVYINGKPLNEPYLQGTQTSCRSDDECGRGQPITVPEGTVFVMGDNRPNSSDSREWAALPLDRIIGKAWVSYWPREMWGVVPSPTYATQP